MSTSTRERAARFASLDTRTWDLVIVGGGITGVGVAREAARRGLSCVLVEQRDYAWGTSSRSSKMVHGGLRYIAQGDVKLTRDAVRERERLLREAPELVSRLGYWFGHRKGRFPGKIAFGLVCAVYDRLAGIHDHRFVKKDDVLVRFPGFDGTELVGSTRYTDSTVDDARLVLRVLDEAIADGTVALNYAKVTSLVREGGLVRGCVVQDVETGAEKTVRARCVVNATGAWADRLRREVKNETKVRPLRGSHIVLSRARLAVDEAIVFVHRSDKRPVFIFPWEGRTIIGTTDLDHPANLDLEAHLSAEELEYLLSGANAQFPTAHLTRDDVISTWSGIRPVVASGKGLDPSKERREHVVWDDGGLVTVTGGKLTTFRLIALDVLAAVATHVPGLDPADTGGAIFRNVGSAAFKELDAPIRKRFVGRFGFRAKDAIACARDADRETIEDTDVTWGELRWALRAEQVVHLDDLLLRRTRLGNLLREGGRSLETRLATLCKEELGWDARRFGVEWNRYLGIVREILLSPRAETFMSYDGYVLAIDNGTQSVRAIVFDTAGEIVARTKIEIEPYFSTAPGYAEQRAEVYWDALCRATKTLFAENPTVRGKIRGVGVTTQRGTVIPVDANGDALRPAITWLDQREVSDLPELGGLWPALIYLTGESETVSQFRAQAESNWIAANEPAVWAKTHKLLLLSGYHTHKLTGRFVDSVGCQVGYLPFDFRRLDYAPSWDWKWKALSIRRDQLPELATPGTRLGSITREASLATGIPEGTDVIAAGADKACEVLGSGCVEPDVGCLSYGTTATINAANRQYVEPVWMIPPYPAAVPRAFNTEIQIFRGFWMVEWFKREFAQADVARAAERGVPVETLLEESIARIPAGSMGLTLQPYWTPGLRQPGREGKGAIIGFGDVHTRAHVYRAILEGLAYALRQGKERIEKRTHVRMRSLRVSGGGSQSDVAMQITADVFGLPAERPHTYETSALGAAMCVAVGVGAHASFATAVDRMTRTRGVFLPRPDARATYDALFREVYQPMYGRLRPLYEAIRTITGYPR